MKGVSEAMWIIVASVVILVCAIVVIVMFTGNMQIVMQTLFPWLQSGVHQQMCRQGCQTYCTDHRSQEPVAWSGIKIMVDGKEVPCSGIMPDDAVCDCKSPLSVPSPKTSAKPS